MRAKVQAYIAAGATKFVMRPCGPFDGWREQIEILAHEVIGRCRRRLLVNTRQHFTDQSPDINDDSKLSLLDVVVGQAEFAWIPAKSMRE